MEAELVQINMYATASVPFWCSNFTWQLQRSILQEPEDSTFRILLRDILSNVCVFLFLATGSFLGTHASVRTQVHWPFIIQACRTWTPIFLSHNILVPWLYVVSLRAINRITVSGIVLFNGPIKLSIVLLPLQFYNEVHWKGCWPQLEHWFTKKRTWTCFKWQEICSKGI